MSNKAKPTSKRSICAALSTLLFVAMLFSALFLTGCSKKVSDFTEEQHKQRITERLQKQLDHWSYGDKEKYVGFEVYSLYDQNDKLSLFLIELEPCNFVFVMLMDEPPLWVRTIFGGSMYRYRAFGDWSPYVLKADPSEKEQFEKEWILDENGEKPVYNKSPYYVTGNIDNKKYILETNRKCEYVCAIKKDGLYVNLISGETFDIDNDDSLDKQATIWSPFYAGVYFEL